MITGRAVSSRSLLPAPWCSCPHDFSIPRAKDTQPILLGHPGPQFAIILDQDWIMKKQNLNRRAMDSKTEAMTKCSLKPQDQMASLLNPTKHLENPFLLKVFQEGEGILLSAHHGASGINTKSKSGHRNKAWQDKIHDLKNTNKQKADAKNLFTCPIPGNRNQLHIKIVHQHVRVISRQFNTGRPLSLTRINSGGNRPIISRNMKEHLLKTNLLQ